MRRKRKTREECKEAIIKHIQNNPNATSQDIKKATGSCPHRFFVNLKNAYAAAGVTYLPTRRARADIKKEIKSFLEKHPEATTTEIVNATGVSITRTFGTMKNLFEECGARYPRRHLSRTKSEGKEEILNYLRKTPNASLDDVCKKLKINPFKYFKNFNSARKQVGIKLKKIGKKNLKQRARIISYVKENPNCTQWEINKACKTHVQYLFDNGIIEAYEKAGVEYPYHRRQKYGAANSHIQSRARAFEKSLNKYLSKLGEIQVRTNRGVADAVVKLHGKPYVIEIKDYESKPITTSEAKQINRYMEDLKIPNGIIICKHPQKRRNYNINSNKIKVMTKEEFLNTGIW